MQLFLKSYLLDSSMCYIMATPGVPRGTSLGPLISILIIINDLWAYVVKGAPLLLCPVYLMVFLIEISLV